jgi:transposase
MGRNRSTNKASHAMPLVHPNAAAIDIGATLHMAAVSADRTPEPVRSFGTFTADLHRLVDWFTECGVETVVMESTGVYWIPIFELLDARGFAVFLVNARDAKHVPGRKTDVSDAQWLQRLHSYGLLSTSFRPKGRIAELRSYVRQRERLLEYAASHIQHMQKALMEMNLQVHHVVADITGSTGCGSSVRSWPANVIPLCWRPCAIRDVVPMLGRSRRRSAAITAPNTCLRSSRRSPYTTHTKRRYWPATPG